MASDFFQKMVKTLGVYKEAPQVRVETGGKYEHKPRFTQEESVLHCLHENGLDVEALESYVKDDVERLGTKLGVMHERMKSHLAELLRPVLDPNLVGSDGVGAFNDNSEQFVSGDFAEELGEDFFGLREMGIMEELGLDTVSVPLHLLQNRLSNQYQRENAGYVSSKQPTYRHLNTAMHFQANETIDLRFFANVTYFRVRQPHRDHRQRHGKPITVGSPHKRQSGLPHRPRQGLFSRQTRFHRIRQCRRQCQRAACRGRRFTRQAALSETPPPAYG